VKNLASLITNIAVVIAFTVIVSVADFAIKWAGKDGSWKWWGTLRDGVRFNMLARFLVENSL
jgi:hypothetical protein